ncbi:MAG: sulfite exporter TauE/SafE family protein [Pirellulaceae bacterium]|nr:sulfite exporter TauE/SafE family protein [Pirellulaceae bacterium]
MLPLIGTVFVASLFGSLHCVGMCGPLALLASSSVSPQHRHQRSVHVGAVVAYHGSRIVAYALAGAIVGLLGAGIQHTGSWLGLQRLAASLAGGSMLVIGLLGIVRLASGTAHAALLPKWLQRRLASGHAWARRQPPLARAASIGLLTAILPCGWLFAFLIVAAGTARPLEGALVMAVFALGAIPALAGMALSMTLLIGRFRTIVPWCSAVLVTIVGAVTLLERSQIDLEPMMTAAAANSSTSGSSQLSDTAHNPTAAGAASHSTVHGQLANANPSASQATSQSTSPSISSRAKLTSQVLAIDHAKLPCCIEREAALANGTSPTPGEGVAKPAASASQELPKTEITKSTVPPATTSSPAPSTNASE